jgi:hypothetical protein
MLATVSEQAPSCPLRDGVPSHPFTAAISSRGIGTSALQTVQ